MPLDFDDYFSVSSNISIDEFLTSHIGMIEEIKAQAEAIKDEIKNEMTERNIDEMQIEDYIVKYIDVLTTRFDTKRFKEQLGEATYNAFTKQVSSKRFSIAH